MNTMSDTQKKGRPAKGQFSNKVKLTVRISEPLDEKLEKYCSDNETTKPETVRQALEKFLK